MTKVTTNDLVEFLDTYYRRELGALAERYPNDQRDLWIDYNDVWRWNTGYAEELLADVEEETGILASAANQYDLPVDVDLSGVTVRVHNLPDDRVKPINELRKDDTGNFKGVSGIIEQATPSKEVPEVLAYDCHQCGGVPTKIPQNDPNDIQEPYECGNCGNNGPFTINHDASVFADEIKLNLKQPADKAPNGQGDNITVTVRDSLLEVDGNHIQTYTGERVTVNGHIKRRRESQSSKEFIRYLDAHSLDFHDEQDAVDVQDYIEDIQEEAARDDCIERFAQSLVPQLYETEAWESGLLVAVAYLFGAPRIDLRDSPTEADATYRGDIHIAYIGDPGTMKSGVSRAIHQFSPQSEHRSATGLSSEVGLTASAVDDSTFSDGWTLKPGILVRGNGGHVILEEIDKTSADLERMNDGLEGNQQITVDKAGINATLDTRVGLLVTGNPEDGRFDPTVNIPDQINIDSSLLSRFDAIVTLEDSPDVDIDKEIAGTIGEAYKEAAEAEFGDRDEFDELDRYITPEMGRAWIQYARENINPIPTDDAVTRLQEWYSEEARQLNDDDIVVPATPRKMEVGLRFASAFARVRLSESIEMQDVARAIEVQKMLIGQTYDAEAGVFNADKHTQESDSQKSQVEKVTDTIADNPGISVSGVVEKTELEQSTVEHHIQNLRQKGSVYEPTQGELEYVNE
jgi:replicative DNA helicase Mcm